MLLMLLISLLAAIAFAVTWAGRGEGDRAWPEHRRKILTMFPVVVIWVLFMIVPYRKSLGLSAGTMVVIFQVLPSALASVGAVIIASSRQRRGLGLRCTDCDYPLQGLTLDRSCRPCPECGRGLTDHSGTSRGVRAWNVRLISVGAAVVLLGLGIPLSSLLPPGYQIRPMILAITPTSTLIDHVGNSKNFLLEEWAELRTRTLSDQESEHLALTLLEHRDALQLHAWSDDSKWLIAQAAAGRLSRKATEAALRRFVSPAFESGIGTSRLWTSQLQAWGIADCFAGNDLWLIVDSDSGRGSLSAAPAALGVTPSTFTNRPGFALTADTFTPQTTRVTLWVFLTPKGTPAVEVNWSGSSPTLSGALLTVPIVVTR